MRISLVAVGKLKAGPESELAARYLDRFAKTGPAIGLELAKVTEFTESRAAAADARKREEAALVRRAVPEAGLLVLLDERGKHLDSPDFANHLGQWRDGGRRDVVLAIGGPDGHDAELAGQADLMLCLGRMTWPHQIARILLAEQLYRAVTILSGHPYHRV